MIRSDNNYPGDSRYMDYSSPKNPHHVQEKYHGKQDHHAYDGEVIYPRQDAYYKQQPYYNNYKQNHVGEPLIRNFEQDQYVPVDDHQNYRKKGFREYLYGDKKFYKEQFDNLDMRNPDMKFDSQKSNRNTARGI